MIQDPWSKVRISPGMIFRILDPKKVYCLLWFQDPWSKVSILPGMISGSSFLSKYIAWYDFRILYLEKVYCLVWFQDPLTWELVSLSSRLCTSLCTWLCPWLCGCLRMCFCTSWLNFANMAPQAKWLAQQDPPRNSVLGQASKYKHLWYGLDFISNSWTTRTLARMATVIFRRHNRRWLTSTTMSHLRQFTLNYMKLC